MNEVMDKVGLGTPAHEAYEEARRQIRALAREYAKHGQSWETFDEQLTWLVEAGWEEFDRPTD